MEKQPLSKVSESKIQADAFRWLWNTYPHTRRCFFAIPNGGFRNVKEAASMKATGTVAGIPDTCLIWKKTPYFFEFKSANGKISKEQHYVQMAFSKQGVVVWTVRDLEQFQNIINMIINGER